VLVANLAVVFVDVVEERVLRVGELFARRPGYRRRVVEQRRVQARLLADLPNSRRVGELSPVDVATGWEQDAEPLVFVEGDRTVVDGVDGRGGVK